MVQGTDEGVPDSGGTLTVGLPKIIDHRDLIIKQPAVLPYVTAGVNDLLGACLRSPDCFSSIKFRLLAQ